MSAAGAPAALLGAIKANWTVSYVAVGCTAWLIVDYLQTLPDEIRYMWPTRMSVMKVLFFLVRYYPFAHTSIAIRHHADLTLAGNLCITPFTVCCFSTIFVTWICDAITYIRVYAFTGRRRGMFVFLVLCFTAVRVVEFVLVFKFAKTVRFIPLPASARLGCVAAAADTLLLSLTFVCVLLSLISVTCIMVVSAWRRRDLAKGMGASSLIHLVVSDGVAYFICLSTLAVANIIYDHTAPQNGSQYTMLQIQIHANAILTGRMLIHLREFSARDISFSGSAKYQGKQNITTEAPTEIQFASYASGEYAKTMMNTQANQVNQTTHTDVTIRATSPGGRETCLLDP